MLLYAITDRRLLCGDEAARGAALVKLARGWARGGVDFIQIREKDLGLEGNGRELLGLARAMVDAVKNEASAGAIATSVLLNGPPEIALAAGCAGVHLPGGAGGDAVSSVRERFAREGRQAVVSVACHSVEDAAAASAASLLLFAPVFEKRVGGEEPIAGQGLSALSAVCAAAGNVPVLALGGVTGGNAQACVEAGAAGVAAIRLFLREDWRGLRTGAR